MAGYQALYRAWRPDRFADVCGQEGITRTLRRQITGGHIAHAYLFCGSRGTGKTTTAKVFARAVNCLRPVDGEPCGECDVCVQLKNESNMDVLEIDAASNNGVDEVRLLRDRIAYPPTVCRYKVYIIDEVHMLSSSAFNALLKTLEEPPSHAIFILATTEPQRLPATVLSRCQRYDFHRIAADVIVKRLQVVLDGIGRTASDAALNEIATAAEGGMRDALSLLDMCLSYETDTLSDEVVRDVLGAAGREFMFEFVGHIESGNAAEALRMIDQAMRDGRDPQVFAREVSAHVRTLCMAQLVGDSLAELAEITQEDAKRFREQGQKFEPTRLMRTLDMFIHAESDMKVVSSQRPVLEMYAIRACTVSEKLDVDGLKERVEALEKALRSGTVTVAPRSEKPVAAAATPAAPEKPASEPKGPVTPDQQMFEAAIADFAANSPSIRGYLPLMKFVRRNENVVEVAFDKSAHFQMQVLERKSDAINAALTQAYQMPMKISMSIPDRVSAPTKNISGENLTRTFDVFGRDKVEVIE